MMVCLLLLTTVAVDDAFRLHHHHVKVNPYSGYSKHVGNQRQAASSSCVRRFLHLRRASPKDQNDDKRWASSAPSVVIDETKEKLESIKAGLLSIGGGSIFFAPLAILGGLLSPDHFSADWEFNTDMLAATLGLFGLVYRYAVRRDGNEQLKQGVVGAFLLTRTLNLIHVPAYCTAIPLDCGPPFHYFEWSMVVQGVANGAESLAAFGGAAYCLEMAFEKKWIGKFPST